jgi:hypothetical protein
MPQEADMEISMAKTGEALQSGYAERLIWTIKEEEIDLSDHQDYTDTIHQLGRFLNEVQMHKRIHFSLGGVTPAESERQWLYSKPLNGLFARRHLGELEKATNRHQRRSEWQDS